MEQANLAAMSCCESALKSGSGPVSADGSSIGSIATNTSIHITANIVPTTDWPVGHLET